MRNLSEAKILEVFETLGLETAEMRQALSFPLPFRGLQEDLQVKVVSQPQGRSTTLA
jgi:hypothetical protein